MIHPSLACARYDAEVRDGGDRTGGVSSIPELTVFVLGYGIWDMGYEIYIVPNAQKKLCPKSSPLFSDKAEGPCNSDAL
jgi:hypothetical protein